MDDQTFDPPLKMPDPAVLNAIAIATRKVVPPEPERPPLPDEWPDGPPVMSDS